MSARQREKGRAKSSTEAFLGGPAAAFHCADGVISSTTPVNDFYNKNVTVREDGRVMRQMYLWQVKPAAAAKSKYDFREKLATIVQDEAWRPLRDGGCPLIKA